MKIKHFENPQNLEQLKTQYRKLAFTHHPDKGGNVETMQAINNEYEYLFKILQSETKNASEKIENINTYKDIINELIKYNLTIEIIGIYIWLQGEKNYIISIKDTVLKPLGFTYAPKKQAWYYKPSDYIPKTRKNWSLNQIRSTFGNTVIKEAYKPEEID